MVSTTARAVGSHPHERAVDRVRDRDAPCSHRDRTRSAAHGDRVRDPVRPRIEMAQRRRRAGPLSRFRLRRRRCCAVRTRAGSWRRSVGSPDRCARDGRSAGSPSTQTPERSVAIPDRPSRKLADVSARGYGIAAYPTICGGPIPARSSSARRRRCKRPPRRPSAPAVRPQARSSSPSTFAPVARVVLGHVAAETATARRADVRAAAVDSDIVGSTDVLELGDGRRSRSEQPEPTLSERGDPDPIVPGRERARMAPDDRNLLGPARPGVDSAGGGPTAGGLRKSLGTGGHRARHRPPRSRAPSQSPRRPRASVAAASVTPSASRAAATSSEQLSYRSPGSFASPRRMTSSSPRGVGGGSSRWAKRTAASEPRGYGGLPV